MPRRSPGENAGRHRREAHLYQRGRTHTADRRAAGEEAQYPVGGDSGAKRRADPGVKRIYPSEVARTQQPAEPLAKRLNIPWEAIPSKDIDGLLTKLRTGAPSGVALVVGHSNTVPEIIRRLGGGAVPPIGDNEYDRIFVLTLTGDDQATVVTLRYAGCAP